MGKNEFVGDCMGGLIRWIANNPYWVVAGLGATFLALFLAIVIPIIQHKKKAIGYTISTDTLLKSTESLVDGIEVFYNKQPIHSLYVSKLHIWNTGNVLLKSSDVYPTKPFTVNLLPAGKFLKSEIINESSDTCNFKVCINESKDRVEIGFDFLEKRQGATINFYHTESKSIELKGKVIEGKVIDRTQIQIAIETMPYMIFPTYTKIFEMFLAAISSVKISGKNKKK